MHAALTEGNHVSSAHLSAYIAGLALGGGLIIAIGAQNAFVLRQGIRRDHVFAVAGTCVLTDWTLIAAGALGFGALVERFPSVTSIAAWGGAAFLLFYGARSFLSAIRPDVLGPAEKTGVTQGSAAIVTATLAVSLLNPHVYLDTVVLIGGIAAQYEGFARLAFTLGAYTASAAWFFALAYGASALAPVLSRPQAWRALDASIGVIMWWIALGLVRGQLGW